MKRVLVTGCCGFVGRHFVKRLIEDGHGVSGVDDLSSGLAPMEWPDDIYPNPFTAPWAWYYKDCRDFFKEAKAGEFDVIYHCAAVVGGRLKIEGDPLAVATDLSIDAEFFNWAVRGQLPRKVVYFSSSAVYPIELQTRSMHCALHESFVNFDTTRIGRPDLTYGFAKLAGEYLAQIAANKYGLNVVIYRPFSGYGEDQALDYPFPTLIKRVLTGENPFTVWGSGEQQRDFIHIDDVVEAVLATQDVLEPGAVLNLGSGLGMSFVGLVHFMHEVLAKPHPTLSRCVDKPEGVFARYADTYNLLHHYRPKIDLAEGIRRVAAHLDKTLVKV